MAQVRIGQGPGNAAPDTEYKSFKAGAAISKGEVVALSGVAEDGYTVVLADADATATAKVVAVAAEDVASGAWGKFIVSGFCDYLVTDGNVATDTPLISDATAGAATSGAFGTATNLMFGWALADDSGTVCSKAVIFKTI